VRILIVTPYYAPAWAYGGPPRVTAVYASGLAARGHDVTVFATDVLDEHRARRSSEVVDGVEVRRFANLSNRLAFRRKKYLPPRLPTALAREARRYDVILTTETRTVPTALGYLASRRAGVPLANAAYGSLPDSPGLRGRVKAAYDSVLVQPMLASASLLLAQTEHEARLYREHGASPESVRLLPLPLSLSERPPRRNGRLRAMANASDGLPLLLFLGRIHYLKGLDVLIDAAAPLLRDRRAALVVVGRDDGSWPQLAGAHSELLESGGLAFVGPVYGDERFELYADADLFCLTPRHWEETSLASLEAASCGAALVLTEQADVPGLEPAGGGFVVPCTKHAVRDALVRALERAEAMGPAAQAHVEAQHEASAVVARLDEALRAVAR
jgi:glycosyltransferase involved in cell wall biosynthesis